jgi:hypothetical protein
MPRTTRRKRVLWAADELKTLRKLAGKEGVRKIARLLKRSEAAVRFKAWQKRIKLAVRKAKSKIA